MAKFEIFSGQEKLFSTDHEPILITFLNNPQGFIPQISQQTVAQFAAVLSALPEASSSRQTKDVPTEVRQGEVRLRIA